MSEESIRHADGLGAGSSLVSRNLKIAGHRTSVRLEPEMWQALAEIADREGVSHHALCSEVDARRAPNSSLTSAIRVFLMAYFQAAATEDGHRQAHHGAGWPFQGTPFDRGAVEPVAETGRRRRVAVGGGLRAVMAETDEAI